MHYSNDTWDKSSPQKTESIEITEIFSQEDKDK